ncbi:MULTISPECIES: hypothetical protein [Kordiimonas]|jgi:hypothetical protein|uniref:Uncharacterized protein n=1 Tax=Kordiimonas lacus TaxID=637679 RepID=A0A1G7F0F0_9PROT|nr:MULTISPECIES: hypothetical protein [Kordiimonas]SDE69428.1 hypothetical protein SAMN04488071_3565 [Kordiimonas lacus]
MRFLLIAVLFVFAFAVPSGAEALDIQLKFSKRLEKDMKKINEKELQREAMFRKYRIELEPGKKAKNLMIDKYQDTIWANEYLLPDLNTYSVPNLMRTMAWAAFHQIAEPGFNGTLVIEVDSFFIPEFPLARYRSHGPRMNGKFTLLDGAGNVMAEAEVAARVVKRYTVSTSYQGPEFAYAETAVDGRMGPIVAAFVEKGLEDLLPGADAPGPILVQMKTH